ncbi:hypothetical protein HMPREF9123_1349 [Neisseria bacilliformis ATCC BAA-1200]|uniref:Uncharacterized protein n=1 Tax=Neisseria bacilliformis ATCC BAA-1200 TaxID=888742 RepID=F2BCC1_9NEIS|nr:hypothetical protein HMPREF9123_1349 [Neisseria bacilliformis ATCC BAA-1200]
MLTISLAAVFLAKNPRLPRQKCPQVSNLAALFSLHSGIFYSKNRSQAECQHTLGRAGCGKTVTPSYSKAV